MVECLEYECKALDVDFEFCPDPSEVFGGFVVDFFGVGALPVEEHGFCFGGVGEDFWPAVVKWQLQ